jgi:hypothetical protein
MSGVHYRKLESDLSRPNTQRILSVLQHPTILRTLVLRPLNAISILRLREKALSGIYDYEDASITVNSARKMGVHYGIEFRPGVTFHMSEATRDLLESIRRTMLHETAHHLEFAPNASELIKLTFADPRRRPITRYAASSNWREYFAETFVAYFVEGETLARHDPLGSMMVKAVLAAVGTKS